MHSLSQRNRNLVQAQVQVPSLTQALTEIVANALDARPTVIRVVVLPLSAGGFSVEDDGHGIPAAAMQAVGSLRHLTSRDGCAHGEALASIATACVLRISSRAAGSFQGFQAQLEFGRRTWSGPCGAHDLAHTAGASGTRVEVRGFQRVMNRSAANVTAGSVQARPQATEAAWYQTCADHVLRITLPHTTTQVVVVNDAGRTLLELRQGRSLLALALALLDPTGAYTGSSASQTSRGAVPHRTRSGDHNNRTRRPNLLPQWLEEVEHVPLSSADDEQPHLRPSSTSHIGMSSGTLQGLTQTAVAPAQPSMHVYRLQGVALGVGCARQAPDCQWLYINGRPAQPPPELWELLLREFRAAAGRWWAAGAAAGGSAGQTGAGRTSRRLQGAPVVSFQDVRSCHPAFLLLLDCPPSHVAIDRCASGLGEVPAVTVREGPVLARLAARLTARAWSSLPVACESAGATVPVDSTCGWDPQRAPLPLERGMVSSLHHPSSRNHSLASVHRLSTVPVGPADHAVSPTRPPPSPIQLPMVAPQAGSIWNLTWTQQQQQQQQSVQPQGHSPQTVAWREHAAAWAPAQQQWSPLPDPAALPQACSWDSPAPFPAMPMDAKAWNDMPPHPHVGRLQPACRKRLWGEDTKVMQQQQPSRASAPARSVSQAPWQDEVASPRPQAAPPMAQPRAQQRSSAPAAAITAPAEVQQPAASPPVASSILAAPGTSLVAAAMVTWSNPAVVSRAKAASRVLSLDSWAARPAVAPAPSAAALVPGAVGASELRGAWRVLGQVDRRFICAVSVPTGLLVAVDQHAAHERCRLEHLTTLLLCAAEAGGSPATRGVPVSPPSVLAARRGNAGGPEPVPLCSKPPAGVAGLDAADNTTSLQVGLSAVECATQARYGVELARWGWRIEEGPEQGAVGTTAVITAAPHVFGVPLGSKDLHSWLAELSTRKGGNQEAPREAVHAAPLGIGHLPSCVLRVLRSRACRTAIMFGDPLLVSETQDLFRALCETRVPLECAHGRPTMAPLVSLRAWRALMTSEREAAIATVALHNTSALPAVAPRKRISGQLRDMLRAGCVTHTSRSDPSRLIA